MKKICITLCALIIFVLGAIAFTNLKLGAIRGKVTPPQSANVAAIITGADTLKTEIVQGSFTFTNLKEGVYTVFIKSNAPYKDTTMVKIAVKDSSTTDLGLIKLRQ